MKIKHIYLLLALAASAQIKSMDPANINPSALAGMDFDDALLSTLLIEADQRGQVQSPSQEPIARSSNYVAPISQARPTILGPAARSNERDLVLDAASIRELLRESEVANVPDVSSDDEYHEVEGGDPDDIVPASLAPQAKALFNPNEIADALAVAGQVNVDGILRNIEEGKANRYQEALRAGLKKFKKGQTVLWATEEPVYHYTEDETQFTLVDSDRPMSSEFWDSSVQAWRFKHEAEITDAEGKHVAWKTVVTDKDVDVWEAVPAIDRWKNYLTGKKRYKKYVSQEQVIVDKEQKIPLRFGIYQRDIVDAGILAGNVAAEYCFNRYIKSLRINRIVEHILANAEDTESFLELVGKSLDDAEKAYLLSIEGKGFLEGTKLRAAYLLEVPKIKELFKTYSDRLAGASFNPFNKQFFMNAQNWPVIAGRILLNRATDYLERTYVIPDYQHAVTETAIAYEANEKGELEKILVPPISLVSVAKLAVHPKLFFQSAQRNITSAGSGIVKAVMGDVQIPSASGTSGYKFMSKLAELPIPDWVFGEKAQQIAGAASEILIEGLSMKMFNDHCANQWVEFLAANHAELSTLVKEYRIAKTTNPVSAEAVALAKANIRKFVQQAHDPVWFMPASHWYMRFWGDHAAKRMVANTISTGIMGVAAWKAWKWFKGK